LGVGDYLGFGLRHPVLFLRHAARDTLIFVGKSGIERLVVDYAEVNQENRGELQDTRSGWRRRLEKQGVGATLRYLWQSHGAILAVSIVSSVVTILWIGLAVIGSWCLLSNSSKLNIVQRFTAMLLVSLPLYILVFTQIVNAMQSRHRAPAEAALVLLALWACEFLGRFSRSPFQFRMNS
jgi:hypothetical protein